MLFNVKLVKFQLRDVFLLMDVKEVTIFTMIPIVVLPAALMAITQINLQVFVNSVQQAV